MKKTLISSLTALMVFSLSAVPASATISTTVERIGQDCRINVTAPETEGKLGYSTYLTPEGVDKMLARYKRFEKENRSPNLEETTIIAALEECKKPAPAEKSNAISGIIAAVSGLAGAIIGALVAVFAFVPALRNIIKLP
ncbi:hypothetical protein P4N68_09195 [Corynebacterium felinum]|uniref:DNA integrity scanning protein DisA with diadenylate cyclase activity n=1 Tax=Corynebacterium felinum TaxID=131318 RepID=A0ABU2B9D8_9CORY|nr:hypothetical protein [Corynebacterium felinum]MDF5821249.1 hypothetical protein [Corynebacterium felinum]MDR7355232.1 DNA integrity scanning protein DisA with diadenylate cyclase activity [Corynebacterium felinum]WJY94583.1 hypothetical protein CFELI_04770 [Corynebacterium felinum]